MAVDATSPFRTARALFGKFLNIVFPLSCAACRAPLHGEDAFGLCPECKKGVLPRGPNACVQCAEAIDGELAGAGLVLCGECRLSPPPFNAAVAALRYEKSARELVHAFKFGGRARLVLPIAALLCAELHRAPFMSGVRAIVPVPLHRKRLFRRGYNQSFLLAREIGKAFNIPVEPEWLERVRHTPSQFSLSRAERRENIRGAFAAGEGAEIKGMEVLLVDDVMTTGATLAEAAKTLKKAGASKVFCAAAARA